MLMRAKRDHHLNKSESLYQIFILLVFLIHKRDLVITCVKNKLSISFLILKNDNINSLCIVCGSFDFPVICKKKKIAIKFGKRFDVTDISQCRKAGYSICDNCEY